MLQDFCQNLPEPAAAAAAVAAATAAAVTAAVTAAAVTAAAVAAPVAAAAAVAVALAAVAVAAAADPAAAWSGGSAAAAAASEAGQCLVSEEVDQRLTAGLQHYGSDQLSHPEACGCCPWTGCCLQAVWAGSGPLPLTDPSDGPENSPCSGFLLLMVLRRTCSTEMAGMLAGVVEP